MSASFLAAAETRTGHVASAQGSELNSKMLDLSIEGNDPSSFGGLVFGDNRKAWVKAEFDKAKGPDGRLKIRAVWELIFVPDERSEYDFDTFDTDLQATCEGCGETMAWTDVQKFFEENL